MSDSQFPAGGSNTKYIVGGLILLAGAVGLIFLLTPGSAPPPPEPAPPPPPKQVERVNPLAEQGLILEEETEPDAGPPEEVVDKPKPRSKRPKRSAWDCAGELDRAGLSKVVASHRAQVRTCYERRLKVNSILQGDLRLRVKIGSTGSVVATQVGGSLRDNEVFGCVRRVAQSWQFPNPTGGDCAVVDIPFQLSPRP